MDKTTSSHHSIDNMAKSCRKLVRKKYGIYLVVLQTMYFQCMRVCYITVLLNKDVSIWFTRISKQ